MKKIFISVSLLLTSSIATTGTTYTTSSNEKAISTLTNDTMIITETRSFRTTRINRKSREARIIKIERDSSSRIARVHREVRQDRLVTQIVRKARKIAYVSPRINKKLASFQIKEEFSFSFLFNQ